MSLREYERKRDFTKTAEPAPRKPRRAKHELSFVIQKHDASRLHYDFRLELDGTLKSWAVPKGVPFERGDKRLAVHVEDHPLDYAGFEGIIPEGQYGGGTVMVWDRGTWECLGGDPARDLEHGKLHFALHGTKLDGEWTLVRTRIGEGRDWLLIKSGEDMRPVSKKSDDESVLTQRTMHQIAAQKTAEWQTNRVEKPRGLRARIAARTRKKAKPSGEKPVFVEPMKAKLVTTPPAGAGWIFELKFDGFRALAIKDGDSFELLSRNAKDLARKFPDLADAIRGLPPERMLIDGEIVALDAEGRSSFQLLQAFELGEERPPICFYAFDLLNLEGRDLTGETLQARKAELETLVGRGNDAVRFSASIEADPRELLAQVKARGLEGIIGKRIDSKYESGRRSGAWIKLKCVAEQEFVIGGYTAPQGSRSHFGALLVGFFEGKKLKFAGKVGTGFNAKLLRELHRQFQALRRDDCPFSNLPERKGGRWSPNLTAAEMKRCTWLNPELVCQVKFTEWTRDEKLRQPVFLGLREDKAASEVVREK